MAYSVIHIDTEMSWRGGQQQAVYLFEAMHKQGYNTLMVCKSGSAMQDYCQKHSLPHYSISCTGELDMLAAARIALLSRRYINPILQVHNAHSVTLGLLAKLFSPKLKLVVTRRVDFSIRKNLLSLYKYKNQLIDKIVCISDNIRNVLLKDDLKVERLTIIHSGINIHRFDAVSVEPAFRQTWGIPDGSMLIGTVAAFAGHKDYPTLLQAAKQVADANPHAYFMAVGDGPLRQEVVALIQQLGLGHRFILAGFQSNVGSFLKQFDIFVLASKKEGLGTSVLDALSVGLPVVAAASGGIPEMITNGENGILVPPRNPEALAHALLTLTENSDARKSISSKARDSISAFDIEHTVSAYLRLYESLI